MMADTAVRTGWGEAVRLVALIAILALALYIETVMKLPFRATGHKAFAGALALLVFADVLGPMLVLPFAALFPIVLVALGYAGPLMIAAWMVPAIAIAAFFRGRVRESLIFCLVVGLLFGVARFAALDFGVHKMPDLARLAGHVFFGLLGGLAAYPAGRFLRR